MGILRTNKNFDQLSKSAKVYLALPIASGFKGATTTLTLLFIDFFGAFALIADPFIESFLWMTYPFVIIFNLWFLTLLFRNVYSTQMEGLLFLVVTSFLSVYLYLFVIYKMVYFTFQFDSPAFIILVILSVILEIVYFSIYYHRLVHHTNEKKNHSSESKFSTFVWSGLYSFPASGYIFYHAFIEKHGLTEYALLFCYLFFVMFFTYLGTKTAYKYLFLKVNPRLIRYDAPPKKEWAKLRKKGVTLK